MEFFEKEPISLYLNNLTLIERIISSKQTIELYHHEWLGHILIINDEIQHIEKYQTIYHELLVHIPASFIPSIQSVLIIGGGSLFAAHEVLKYPSVKKVFLCDYDHEVLELMGRHYQHATDVMDNSKFIYIEEDANDYIINCQQSFDLIINDCFNIAKESKLRGISYYEMLSNRCTPHGACVDIIYRHIYDRSTTIDTLSYLEPINHKALSLVTVPEYPGILHLETIWGQSSIINQNAMNSINDHHISVMSARSANTFNYFSPNNLPFYLYLPPYLKKQFNI